MIKNYFKTAWRNLIKTPIHSAINILGLSIGLSVALIIGLWIFGEIGFNKNFSHFDRIAQVIQNVTNNGEIQTLKQVPYPLAGELRKNYSGDFKRIAMASQPDNYLVVYN
ncbi:MAG: hypothetical protein JWN78_1959, partial [Bacteroidota bacterium]|nr:hypothetical protein [Bacteroidota bacterium]